MPRVACGCVATCRCAAAALAEHTATPARITRLILTCAAVLLELMEGSKDHELITIGNLAWTGTDLHIPHARSCHPLASDRSRSALQLAQISRETLQRTPLRRSGTEPHGRLILAIGRALHCSCVAIALKASSTALFSSQRSMLLCFVPPPRQHPYNFENSINHVAHSQLMVLHDLLRVGCCTASLHPL